MNLPPVNLVFNFQMHLKGPATRSHDKRQKVFDAFNQTMSEMQACVNASSVNFAECRKIVHEASQKAQEISIFLEEEDKKENAETIQFFKGVYQTLGGKGMADAIKAKDRTTVVETLFMLVKKPAEEQKKKATGH